jgi:hypothetical protein
MHRRTLLGALGGLGGLAGCLGGGDPGTAPTDTTASPSAVTPAVTGRSIETTNAECADVDGRADATVGADSVTIEGVTPAPNPCHEATIEGATVEKRQLRVTVGVTETGEGACVQCVGAVTYTATIAVTGGDDIDAVVVEHTEGETHTVER